MEIEKLIHSSQLNIAFLSYEYPPETGGGGIGTYLQGIKEILEGGGHTPIIFCGTPKEHISEEHGIVRIPCANWKEFDINVVEVFEKYHKKYNFDVVEGTDFQAAGLSLKKKFPLIPYVLRLHTPNYICDQLNFEKLNIKDSIRFWIGGLLRGKINKIPTAPPDDVYPRELENFRLADGFLSASKAIWDSIKEKCPVKPIEVVPFSIPITDIKEKKDPSKFIVSFAGRLEKRKGTFELLCALDKIKTQLGDFEIRIAGRDTFWSASIKMSQYLLQRFPDLPISFLGQLSQPDLKRVFASSDVVVFPSYYESFGFVIFEAMGCGSCVITTTGSGPEEFLTDHKDAVLVPPKNIKVLAERLLELFNNPMLRNCIGREAKETIKRKFNKEIILQDQIKFYKGIIQNFVC